jgi:hypothetical protein
LQGNGQRTYQIPTWNIPRIFRILPANLTEIFLAQEMFRTFTVYPADFLIRKYMGKFKMFPKNVPSFPVFLTFTSSFPKVFPKLSKNGSVLFVDQLIIGSNIRRHILLVPK